MLGLQHVAIISTHSSGQWTTTSDTWKCRLEPVSPKVRLEGSRYPTMTHLAIGASSPTIKAGMRLVISRGSIVLGTFYVQGVHLMERPGHKRFSQEIYLAQAMDQ